MGQTQMLFIILGIIICLAALVGVFVMFDNFSDKVPRDAMKLEIARMLGQSQSWYAMPQSLGGAGKNLANIDTELMSGFIINKPLNPGNSITNDKGKFTFVGFAGNPSLTIRGESMKNGVLDGKIEITGTVMINAGNLDGIVFTTIK
ncbi:MAG: hypothetical protein FWG20_04830 [Candidatus Cloacimonetes bacterium]|nr:hypothetical protein [Candidatus Cloacimonadota bacterium]